MTLYEKIREEEYEFDTCDDVYDIIITTVDIDEENDWYSKFGNFIMKNVNVLEEAGGCDYVCDWSAFITENLSVFREAADAMWRRTPKDDDDLTYEWIREIHFWLAGYVSESEYREFMENYAPRIRRVQK